MSNSALVTYTCLSPNCNKPRNHVIDKITIHHMACNITVERCGEIFMNPKKEGSSNYGVDGYGHVGLYVEEANRAWTSGSPSNDNRAVTIEVANDGGAPDWHVSDTAYNKMLDLVEDICRRNGIERLNFTGDATGNLTLHKYFQATGCPGPYLESRMPEIAAEINRRLTGEETVFIPVDVTYQVYDVPKKCWLTDVVNRRDYAGIEGDPISSCYISTNNGNVFYKARPIGEDWLPEVRNREDYAGLLDKPIDAIMVRSDTTQIHYQVELADGRLLPPVTGYDEKDEDNGYAGLTGFPIAKLWVWADPIILPVPEEPGDNPEIPGEDPGEEPGGDETPTEPEPTDPSVWRKILNCLKKIIQAIDDWLTSKGE